MEYIFYDPLIRNYTAKDKKCIT